MSHTEQGVFHLATPYSSPAVHSSGRRRPLRDGPSAPSLGHPHRDRLQVRSGLAAQPGGLARQRFVRFPLGRPLEDPGDLGEQVSPATRELAEPGHRGGLLVAAQLAPPGMVPGLPR